MKARRGGIATWEGPRRAARLWRDGLGWDKREYKALRCGAFDSPDRYIPPFRKVPTMAPNWTAHEQCFAEETVNGPLDSGFWEEIMQEEAQRSRYSVSRTHHSSREWEDEVRSRAEPSLTTSGTSARKSYQHSNHSRWPFKKATVRYPSI